MTQQSLREFGSLESEAARLLPSWISPMVDRIRRQLGYLPSAGPALGMHLARLEALGALRAAVGAQIEAEVHAAGRIGAGYPEIAQALHMTRQNARRRWPRAVNHRPGPQPGRPRRPRTIDGVQR